MRRLIDLARWISLTVAAVYVIGIGLAVLLDHHSEPVTAEDLFDGVLGLGGWLAISLGCIWWGDELGEGLVGAKFGLVSSTSPGWAVKLMGWVLLFLPAVLALTCGLGDRTGG